MSQDRNDKSGNISWEVVVAYFMALFQHLLGGTEEDIKTLSEHLGFEVSMKPRNAQNLFTEDRLNVATNTCMSKYELEDIRHAKLQIKSITF
jgi:hypothetical protein